MARASHQGRGIKPWQVQTDTRWFHFWVYGKANEIRFVKGRLKFGDALASAPFPSLVAIFHPPGHAQGIIRSSVVQF
jgi:transposase